jgi:hypothetical protein
MQKGKNLNAMKWFEFAKKIRPDKKEPYLGEAVSAFKLGMVDKCLDILKSHPGCKVVNEKKRKIIDKNQCDETMSNSESNWAKSKS